MNRTHLGGALAAVIAAAVLTGCAAASTPAAAPASSAAAGSAQVSAAHDEADIAFAQGMVPHHTQAVAMARLVAGRTTTPEVVELATQIAQAQDPEIIRMQGFLQSWSAPAAATGDTGGMAGMGGSGGGMAGMMTDQQMQQLGAAKGAAFDRMFLQMMTEHHNGAITMAQTELRDGRNPEAKALARKIIDAQQAEIATMKGLLAST